MKNYFERQASSLSDLMCISQENTENIIIQGAWDTPKIDYLTIKIAPCNKTARTCKSDEEIKAVLKTSYFAYYSSDNLFDLNNENPAQSFGRNYYIETTYAVKKIINRYLKTNLIYSDNGWITSSISEMDYFSFDSDKESFELLENFGENIVEMAIRKSYYESILSRKYKKIQNVALAP